MISFSKTINVKASYRGFCFMSYPQKSGSCMLNGNYKNKHRYFMVNKKFKFIFKRFRFKFSLISYTNKLVSNCTSILKNNDKNNQFR